MFTAQPRIVDVCKQTQQMIGAPKGPDRTSADRDGEGAAAVENGEGPGMGGLVSRLEWSELERQRSSEDQLAASSLAASAPDAAALRAAGLLDHEGGSPDG